MLLTKKMNLIGYCDDWDQVDNEDLTNYTAECKLDDRQIILEYLYFKKFNKNIYQELGWWLEPGAHEFVNDFEDKWLHNQIDEFGITHSLEFNDFVDDYLVEVSISEEDMEDAMDDYKAMVEQGLEYLDEDELKELWQNCPDGYLDIEVRCDETGQSVYDSVELPELDEEEE